MNIAKTLGSKPWLLLASIYSTQYLGIAFILSLTVILREMGLSLQQLALLNLAVLPMLGKIFYAVAVDKIALAPPKHGQYRTWLLLAQTLMALLLLLMAWLDVQQRFSWLIFLIVLYVLVMSVQDVAIDGLTTKLFSHQDLSFANSLQFSSNLFGNVVGGGVFLMLYPLLGWQMVFCLLAALTALACLPLWRFAEPSTDRRSSQTLVQLWHSIINFGKQHRRWLCLLTLYPIGSGMAFALVNPLLVDGKWQVGDIGFVIKIYGSLVGILSALSAYVFVKKYGKQQTLKALLWLQTLSLLLLIPLAMGYTSQAMVYLAVSVYFAVNPAWMATLATLMMDYAKNQTAKATFFTLQISLLSAMGFMFAALGLAAAKILGYLAVMTTAVVINLVVIALNYYYQPKENT